MPRFVIPESIRKKSWYKELSIFLQGYNHSYISTFATAGAFYLFLSIFPFMILLSSILPRTGLSAETLLEFADGFIPDSMMELISGIIRQVYESSSALLPVSAVVTLWSSSQAFAALIKGVEIITGDLDDDFYLKRRLRAMLYTLLLLLAMVASLALMVFGRHIANLLASHDPLLKSLLPRLLRLRWLAVLAGLTLTFTVIYHWVPSARLSFLHLLPGALFAAVAWMGFSAIFSVYTSWSGSYSAYGSLTTLVIAMIWMYNCIRFVLIGAYLNVYLEPRRRFIRLWRQERRKNKISRNKDTRK